MIVYSSLLGMQMQICHYAVYREIAIRHHSNLKLFLVSSFRYVLLFLCYVILLYRVSPLCVHLLVCPEA